MFTKKQISDARKLYISFAGMSDKSQARLLADPSTNPKTIKNEKRLGILTAPLHMAPSDLSGYQVCPMASEGCRNACLHTAGNPAYLKGKTKSRIHKTRFFFEHRSEFLMMLWAELTMHEAKAVSRNMWSGCRLNATSDIAWETVKLPNGKTVFEEFPNIDFYDYTAIPKRMQKFLDGKLPDNYFLTFSVKENNLGVATNFIKAGGTATIVFDTKRGKPLPQTFKGITVIDGDLHDYRPLDPAGCFVGLTAKGDAIGDTSGFVHRATN